MKFKNTTIPPNYKEIIFHLSQKSKLSNFFPKIFEISLVIYIFDKPFTSRFLKII